jgi:hypothetical protein
LPVVFERSTYFPPCFSMTMVQAPLRSVQTAFGVSR